MNFSIVDLCPRLLVNLYFSRIFVASYVLKYFERVSRDCGIRELTNETRGITQRIISISVADTTW